MQRGQALLDGGVLFRYKVKAATGIGSSLHIHVGMAVWRNRHQSYDLSSSTIKYTVECTVKSETPKYTAIVTYARLNDFRRLCFDKPTSLYLISLVVFDFLEIWYVIILCAAFRISHL